MFDALPGIFTQVLGEDQEIVYTPADGGSPVALPSGSAIFEQSPLMVTLGAGAPEHSANRSILHVPATTIPTPTEGDTVLIDAVLWTFVQPIQPDGKGMILCTLEAPSNV